MISNTHKVLEGIESNPQEDINIVETTLRNYKSKQHIKDHMFSVSKSYID